VYFWNAQHLSEPLSDATNASGGAQVQAQRDHAPMARAPSQAGRAIAFCRLLTCFYGGAHFEHQQSALTVKADVT